MISTLAEALEDATTSYRAKRELLREAEGAARQARRELNLVRIKRSVEAAYLVVRDVLPNEKRVTYKPLVPALTLWRILRLRRKSNGLAGYFPRRLHLWNGSPVADESAKLGNVG